MFVGVRTSIGIGEKTEETEKGGVEHRFLNDGPHVNLSETFSTGKGHFSFSQPMRPDRCSIGEDRISLERRATIDTFLLLFSINAPPMDEDILRLDSNRNRHCR